MDSRTVETDPSVCYRHPGRQSWVLCQRCGRTVCPECQIQAPVGVHCPDCVRETAGGTQWRPVNAAPVRIATRRARPAAASRVRSLLATGGDGMPAASRVILFTAIGLFVVGCFTPLPFAALAATPGTEWQLWRYLTAPFVSSFGFDLRSFLSFGLSALFFWLTAPQLERLIGRPRFLAVAAAASTVGAAAMLLAGRAEYGLSTVLFGGFAALLVAVWDDQRVRVQILVMIGINLLISVALGGYGLPGLVGGMVAGAGTLYLLRIGPERGWKPRTPALVAGGVCAGLVLLAILRGTAF